MTGPRYRPRALASAVELSLRDHPVVVVSGARQTGKTTLVRNLAVAGQREFLSLDDFDVLEMARRRPEDLLTRAGRLTIDEVQRAPELLLAIKKDVDKRRVRGRFLLTGSANLLLMKEVADSLAGRAVYLLLAPFTAGEKRGQGVLPPWSELVSAPSAPALPGKVDAPGPSRDWLRGLLQGGMPPAVLARSNRSRAAWFEGFVRTYVERDVRDLSRVSSLPDFSRLMSLAARRVGQLLNQTDLARDAGLPQATAHRYLNLLEVSFQTVRLTPYTANPSKRLIRAPKLYWWDSGIAAHLLGISDPRALRSSGLLGALLENAVLTGLLAWRETRHPRPGIHFWRTAGGAEVDFVIESGRRLLPVEIKASKRVRSGDLRHLENFLTDYGNRAPFGVVLHDTPGPHRMTKRTIGLPASWFL